MIFTFDGTSRGMGNARMLADALKEHGFEAEVKMERIGPRDPDPNSGLMSSFRVITNAPKEKVIEISDSIEYSKTPVKENKMMRRKLTEILSINEQQQDTGVLEGQIKEGFAASFAQFKLEENSTKIDKFDSAAGKASGTLSYSVADMKLYSPFVFVIKEKMLVLGEEK
jgi:hypothetical protein